MQEQIMTISNAEAMNRGSNINMRNKLGQCRSQEKEEQRMTNNFQQLIQDRIPGNSHQIYENQYQASNTMKPKTERSHQVVAPKKALVNQASQLKFNKSVIKNVARMGCRSHEHPKEKMAKQINQTKWDNPQQI